ncbi:MAG TPA: DUF11 domain-containing protein, partial [Thermoanaerobaculia bacterium]|nr:DUF11 domain-containing protein [Thermoanaerobaculia bacterium]
LPSGTTFVSLSSVAGWSCTTGGPVSCSNPSFAVGSAVFILTVHVDSGVAAGTVLSNTATATSTTGDPDSDDLSATETTTVSTSADLQVTKSADVDPVFPGDAIAYTITVTNAGPGNSGGAAFSDTLPTGTFFVSVAPPAGWTCPTQPPPGSGGTVTCNATGAFAPGSAVFTLDVTTDPDLASGSTISNTATASAGTLDPNSTNDAGTSLVIVDSGTDYFTITPCRVVDTRSTTPLDDDETRDFVVAGACGIPAEARAVAVNITGVDPGSGGTLEVFRTGQSAGGQRVAVSLRVGFARANNGIVALDTDHSGRLSAHADLDIASAKVHVVIDVVGYFLDSPKGD